jgi:hypothetical protein
VTLAVNDPLFAGCPANETVVSAGRSTESVNGVVALHRLT